MHNALGEGSILSDSTGIGKMYLFAARFYECPPKDYMTLMDSKKSELDIKKTSATRMDDGESSQKCVDY